MFYYNVHNGKVFLLYEFLYDGRDYVNLKRFYYSVHSGKAFLLYEFLYENADWLNL